MCPADCNKPVIGLTGGIGSGKSRVARCLAEQGCAVIDADRIARDALKQRDVIDTLAGWWGTDIFDTDGQIDRRKVAGIVFENPEALRKLEALLHPLVHQERQRLRSVYDQDAQVVAIVEDCPLLLESGLADECDVIVFVDASPATRATRVLRDRGWDEGELHRREINQWPLDKKRQAADYVLSNDADTALCEDAIRRLLSEITPRANL